MDSQLLETMIEQSITVDYIYENPRVSNMWLLKDKNLNKTLGESERVGM